MYWKLIVVLSLTNHLENKEKSGGSIFDEKVREMSGENEIASANVLVNVDMAHFISIFCQKLSVLFFCYTADKLESGKNIVSQGNKVLRLSDSKRFV